MNVHEVHGLMQPRSAPVPDMRERLKSIEQTNFFDKLSQIRAAHENGEKFLDVWFEVSARLIGNLTLRAHS